MATAAKTVSQRNHQSLRQTSSFNEIMFAVVGKQQKQISILHQDTAKISSLKVSLASVSKVSAFTLDFIYNIVIMGDNRGDNYQIIEYLLHGCVQNGFADTFLIGLSLRNHKIYCKVQNSFSKIME